MKKLSFILIVTFWLGSCSTLQNFITAPSSLETISALKHLLNGSAFNAISTLSKVSTGGVEALVPDELKPVFNTLNTLGLGDEIDKVSKVLVDGSKIALNESKEIMTDAIKNIQFQDAVGIVTGAPNAATTALKNSMYTTVKDRYSGSLNNELSKTKVNDYWPMAVSAYNLFAKNKINNDIGLSDYVAERAVDALFLTMGKEEGTLRNDYRSMGNATVNKVFDYYLKK